MAGLSEGGQYGGGEEVASQAAERALAAEQAQHGAAARAAAKAAYQLAGQEGELENTLLIHTLFFFGNILFQTK